MGRVRGTAARGLPELQRLVRDAAEQAGGYRRLAERSGGLVRTSTLNSVATGRHTGRFRDATLRGIADCLGRPAREVARMVGAELTEERERHRFVLPRRADALTVPQRRVVLAVVDAIITAGPGAARAHPAAGRARRGPGPDPAGGGDTPAARRVARRRR